MMGAQILEYFFRRDATCRICFHGIIGWAYRLPKPVLNRRIPFLQGPQSGSNDFAARCVST